MSAQVGDRVLSETGSTRRILRAQIHDNPNDHRAAVKITIIHQRKANKATWEDVPGVPLNNYKANDIGKLSLDSAETLALREELERLYLLYEERGIEAGNRNLVVGDEREIVRVERGQADLVRKLLKQGHSETVWRMLVEENPQLATSLSLARVQQQRRQALERFDELLQADVDEAEWQKFLDANHWIFGYGLDYRILRHLERQPEYGGRAVGGRGGQRGDNLMATQAAARFTVLVEVKTASTPLLGSIHRNRTFRPSTALAGGISQVQRQCQTWEVEGSRTDANRRALDDILTVRPKGILVIGRLEELDDDDKKVTFELLRRNTLNPEILTFDELYARAEYIVRDDPTRNANAARGGPGQRGGRGRASFSE